MIEDVQDRRRERERGGRRHGIRFKTERKAEADEDDADILDSVKREQTLKVVLHQGEQDAKHGGEMSPRRRAKLGRDDTAGSIFARF